MGVREGLVWAAQSVKNALAECRKITGYAEERSPNPLVVCVIGDGDNTKEDIVESAQALKSMAFTGGSIDVVAVAVGTDQNKLPILERIASRVEFVVTIDQLTGSIFEVGVPFEFGVPVQHPKGLIDQY